MRSIVVLPQPDGPSNAKKLPCSISSETPLTATTSPKRLVTRSNRMSIDNSTPLKRCASGAWLFLGQDELSASLNFAVYLGRRTKPRLKGQASPTGAVTSGQG